MTNDQLLDLDKAHIWHPYSAMSSDVASDTSVYPVASAEGVRLKLTDGRELIDGMSSWWCAIHGYNHPEMNRALEQQLKKMSHVMFGGLTHQPAVELAAQLLALTPEALQSVFFSDSGSVSVEVAMKMAIQYWHAKEQPNKQQFLTIRNGYHGDTFGAMSVSDPVTGMHSLFNDTLTEQYFVISPGLNKHSVPKKIISLPLLWNRSFKVQEACVSILQNIYIEYANFASNIMCY